MPIHTNLNIDPYFDDFDASKKYYRILFKPGYALQARELTQMQTTLQTQIENFGENIFKEGSIIKACNFTMLDDLQYVKVRDGINPVDYIERTEVLEDGTTREYYYELVYDDTGGDSELEPLRAIVITAARGFESRTPDLNTFFIRYLNSGATGITAFPSGGTLTIEQYYIETDENGDETVVGPETPTDINGDAVPATAIVDPNGSPTAPSVGPSYGVTVSEGIIFQRGHFLFVDEQTIVVTKYNIDIEGEPIEPDEVQVGFLVDESIVTSQVDESLLDNATGSPNEQAPGADRLMLVPRLVAVDTADIEADESGEYADFFTLIRFQNGRAVQIRDVSEYNVLGDQMANRTYEAAGDFMPKAFDLDVARVGDSDDQFENDIVAVVGPGVIYAKGFRIENRADRTFVIDPIAEDETELAEDEPVSFEMRGYWPITGANGVIDNYRTFQTVNLLANNDSVIGTAVIKDINPTQIYFIPGSIRMTANTFRDVRFVKDGVGATGKFAINVAKPVGGQNGLIFPTGMFSTKTVTNYRFPRRMMQNSVSMTSGAATITPAAGMNEMFDENSLSRILVVNDSNVPLTVTAASVSSGNLVINTAGSHSGTVRVYYSATVEPQQPITKTIKEVYVKMYYFSDKSGYTLGAPDCFELLSVTTGDANNEVDYTRSFVLNSGQRPNFYDHGYITRKKNAKLPPDATLMTVKFRCFEAAFSTAANAVNFFSIDSYPLSANDDFNVSQLRDVTNIFGKTHNLRDAIDFRPYRQAIITLANTAGSANTLANTAGIPLPTTGQLFANNITYTVPTPGSTGYVDYEYYLNRTDVITVDKYGNFQLQKGEAAKKSKAPDVLDKTVIAEVFVPGSPALTTEEATVAGDEPYKVQIKSTKVAKAYTMNDIRSIADQVEKLTYYTTLTMLEQATKDLSIKDENGLNRFKNGIVVDTFEDLSNADVNDPEFNAAVDHGLQIMMPSVDMIPFSTSYRAQANVSYHGSGNDRTATLLSANSNVRFLAQPYATSQRPVSTSAFRYIGRVALNPNFSAVYDNITKPAQYRDLRDKQFSDATPKLQKFAPITASASKRWTSKATDKINGNAIVGSQTVKNVAFDLKGNVKDATKVVMGYVITQHMQPFMQPNYVNVRVYGMRPNTRHYFYFDRRDVNQFVRPAKNVGSKFTPYGKYGAAVMSDSTGVIRAQFRIPHATFLCGQRHLWIFDVPGWDNGYRASTSRARGQYSGYAYTLYRAGNTPALRRVETEYNQVETNASVTSRAVAPIDESTPSAPIAQTFFVKKAMCGLAECLYLSKVSVYFARKAPGRGITLQIREVFNGYPTADSLDGSEVRKESSQVAVSATGNTPTTFTFSSPVRLDAEKEYAIVLTADADDPDYVLYTSMIGRRRVGTNIQVAQDWGDGQMFASTNGTAWRAFGGEDMKFDLYRHHFNVTAGQAWVQTDAYEFLTFSDTIGNFELQELAYTFTSANVWTVTCNANSDTLTGTGIGSAFAVGDYIYIPNPTANTLTEPSNWLGKVDAVINTNSVSTTEAPPWSGAKANSRQVVVGTVNQYDPEEPLSIVLEKSSARSARIFEPGDEIIGYESGAEATIDSVDDFDLSYAQLAANRLEDSTNIVRGYLQGPATSNAAIPVANNRVVAPFDDNTYFATRGMFIRSKSADLSRVYNLEAAFAMSRVVNTSLPAAQTRTASPVVDVETATINGYRWRITNDPDTSSAFITKQVILNDGFEGLDFRLWMTAYRPAGTNIRTYIRAQAEGDGTDIKLNDWIELEMTSGSSLYSSISNRDNTYEFEFSVPASAKDANSDFTYSNDGGEFVGFKKFQLKFVFTSNWVFRAPYIADYRGVAFE